MGGGKDLAVVWVQFNRSSSNVILRTTSLLKNKLQEFCLGIVFCHKRKG